MRHRVVSETSLYASNPIGERACELYSRQAPDNSRIRNRRASAFKDETLRPGHPSTNGSQAALGSKRSSG